MSICGMGMETRSRPFLPIISPRVMYFERFDFTLPRTILRKRWWSRSIFWLMTRLGTTLVPNRFRLQGLRTPPRLFRVYRRIVYLNHGTVRLFQLLIMEAAL